MQFLQLEFQLITDCMETFDLLLSVNKKTFICQREVITNFFSPDVVAGQNEDFIFYVLRNTFNISQINN